MLREPGRIEVQRWSVPGDATDHVTVRVGTGGLCGTDLSILRGTIPVQYPRVPGHEMTGAVMVGGALAAGARVVVDPTIACGTCYQCSRGQQNLCPRGALLGRDRDGVLRELISVPRENVYPLPEVVPDDVGPLIQVLTTCVHAHRQTEIFPGDIVVVVGLGVTGLIHVQMARARGAGTLIGVSRSHRKLELARQLGADVVVDAGGDVAAKVAEASEGRGADVVIECAGYVSTFAQAIELARIGGRIMGYGTMTETHGAVPFYDLYYKELLISNPRAAKPEDFPVAISMAAAGSIHLEPLVTHRFPLEQVDRAFAAMERPDALKVLVDVTERG